MSDLPPEIDTRKPHPARVYDYLIGGKNNFAADQETAASVLLKSPNARIAPRENRAFLGRAVKFLTAEAGVRQFLDIGAGLPTANNVHEVAQAIAPSSRIVYADNDPLVLAHARALLTSASEGRTAYIQADIRDPEVILTAPTTLELLDFSQPIGLLLVGILHLVADADKPAEIVATLLNALPSGSYLVASHLTTEHDRERAAAGQAVMRDAGITMQKRDSDVFAEIAFAGLKLVPPGVVLVSEWRPKNNSPRPSPAEVSIYGGVARKPLCAVRPWNPTAWAGTTAQRAKPRLAPPACLRKRRDSRDSAGLQRLVEASSCRTLPTPSLRWDNRCPAPVNMSFMSPGRARKTGSGVGSTSSSLVVWVSGRQGGAFQGPRKQR